MPRITINQSTPTEAGITLNNGSLVVLLDKGGSPMKSYLVTSYRGTESYSKPRAQYCTLIDFATGYPAFEEPASRSTTITRLVRHLYHGKISHTDAKPNQEFSIIKVIPSDEYAINISY